MLRRGISLFCKQQNPKCRLTEEEIDEIILDRKINATIVAVGFFGGIIVLGASLFYDYGLHEYRKRKRIRREIAEEKEIREMIKKLTKNKIYFKYFLYWSIITGGM